MLWCSHKYYVSIFCTLAILYFVMMKSLLFSVLLLLFPAAIHAAGLDDPFDSQAELSVVAISSCSTELKQGALTLSDVIEISLCRNPQTRSAWTSAKAAASQLGVRTAARLPSLTLQGAASSSSGETAAVQSDVQQQRLSLSLNYLLYDFGGREAGIASARESLLAANASGNATMQTVFLQAAQAYFNLMSAVASLEVSRVNEHAASQSLAAADMRYQAGMTTRADRLQAKTALSQEKLNRIRAEGQKQNAMGALANVMGLLPTQPLILAPAADTRPDFRQEENLQQLMAEAQKLRPDLIAAEARIRAARAEVEVAGSADDPQLTFSATAETSRSRSGGAAYVQSQNNSLALTFNFPIFTGFKHTYQTQVAELQLENSIHARDLLAQQVAMQVWQAWQNLRTESQALSSSEDLLASAREAEALSLGRYQENVGNILDLLSAQKMLASARQQHISALYTWHLARLMLAQAIGALDLSVLQGTGEP